MNILPLVMQFFGPVIMNRIAGSLGINSTLAQKAIAAAAPTILAAILGKTLQPGGARALGDAVGKLDPDILGKLGDAIGTAKQGSLADQGGNILGGLLGNASLGALAGALSKHAGVGAGASNTLLGLIAPAILGTLGREQKSANLDAAGLANLLQGQKQQIADAIPPDFAKLLSGTGLLDGLQGKPAAATAATPATPMKPVTTAATSKPAPAGAGAAAMAHHHHFSWGPWLVALAAALALWWSVFGNKLMQDQSTTEIPVTVPRSTTLATPAGALPDALAKTDVGKQLVAALDDARGVITNVKDVATAQAALPKIGDVSSRFDKINGLVQQLSPDARRALVTYVTSQAGLIKTAVANIVNLPGVGPVLKPALDQLVARIDTLTKA